MHGLYVKEAIARTDNAIDQAKQRGDSNIRLIVGWFCPPEYSRDRFLIVCTVHRQGITFSRWPCKDQASHRRTHAEVSLLPGFVSYNHSRLLVALYFLPRHQLVPELDPHNAGVLIVRLDGQGKGMDPDEVTHRLERENESCVVM